MWRLPLVILAIMAFSIARRKYLQRQDGGGAIRLLPNASDMLGTDGDDDVDPNEPCYLLSMPEELIERALGYLGPRDIVSVRKTCRALRAIAETPQLRYNFALATRGYLDVPNRPARRDAAKSTSGTSPLSPTFEGERERCTGGAARTLASDEEVCPHTGKTRATIPTVSLAPWPENPPGARDTTQLSIADKERLLREREERWDNLDPAEIRRFSVAGPAGVYELQDGIFLLCHEYSRRPEDRPTKIRLIPLPSATDPDLEDTALPCKEVEMNFPIADLTMDPSQDLIVVSEDEPTSSEPGIPPLHRYHLLSMSTFKPHPLAARPALDAAPWCTHETPYVTQQLIQVMGDTLLVLVAVKDATMTQRFDFHEEMVAWNWKTGEVLGRHTIGLTLARSSMAMLTPTTVAITMPAVVGPTLREMFGGVPGFMENQNPVLIHPPSIDIYSFARDPAVGVEVEQPLKRHNLDTTTPRFTQLLRLLLPPMRTGAMVHWLHMRPDPAFPVVSRDQATLVARPFTQDPRRGVIVIEIVMANEGVIFPQRAQGEQYEMFILRETLVAMAEEGEERMRDIWAGRGDETPGSPTATGRSASSTRSSSSGTHTPTAERSVTPDSPLSDLSTIADGIWSSVMGSPRYPSNPRRKYQRGSALRTYEWDEWGEYSTRLMAPVQRSVRHWVCSCSGYRFASILRGSPVSDVTHVAQGLWVNILDFSPYSVARFRHDPRNDGEEGDFRVRVLGPDDPTTLESELWDSRVVTRLPYRAISRQTQGHPSGIMIDDQRLMIIERPRSSDAWLEARQNISVWCM